MISKQDILKMARVVTKRSQGYHAPKIVHPNRDWLIGVALFIVVATTGGILNAKTHVVYNNLGTQVGETQITHTEYKTNQADAALMIFRERQKNYKTLMNEIAVVPVPVIQSEDSVATSTEDVKIEEIPDDPILIQE